MADVFDARGAARFGHAVSGAPPAAGRARYTFQQKTEATVHGKACTLCGKKDTDPDPVSPSIHQTPVQIHQMDITEVKWIKPRDQFLELDNYTELHGDPATNGKNHTKATAPDGTVLVNIGNDGKWTKEVSLIFQPTKARAFDNGNDALTQRFTDTRYRDLCNTLTGASSSGNSAPVLQTGQEAGQEPREANRGGRHRSHLRRILKPMRAGAKKAAAKPPKQRGDAGGDGKRPSTGGGGGAAKRGRPKRDAVTLLRTGLRELKEAEHGSKYFTAEWKNVCRNLQNYQIDVGDLIAEEDDIAVLQEYEILEKQVNASKTVLNKICSLGMSHKDTLTCYERQVEFLRTDTWGHHPLGG